MFHVKPFILIKKCQFNVSRETYPLPKSKICGKLITCNKYIVTWSGLESSSHVNHCLCALFFMEEIMKEEYFKMLVTLAKKASQKNEVPVSALLVYNDKIIAKAYNTRHKNKTVLNHAELLVITKGYRKLKDWRLDNCDLYVTLKPCSMCEAVIKQTRIKNVYYLLTKPDNKKEYYRTNIEQANISTLKDEYAKCLKEFFKNKRDKN